MAALDDALAGRSQVVTLAGEPGIGKTRVAQELASQAEMAGAQVHWGRCYEDRGVPPYWPWVQAIRSYFGAVSPEQLRSELGTGASYIADLVVEVRDRLPDLGPSVPLEDPDQARFRLFDSITSFLKSASQNQPLVLVLEDLHWADRTSLQLLQFVAGELAGGRILLVCTYRDIELSRQHPLAETLGELTRERRFLRVLLRGLGSEEVQTYVEVIAGATPPPGLIQTVYNQTEGNPLFVTEIVRLLIQEGDLSAEDEPSANGPRGRRIPEGVREVIGRRLNRLSQRCNEALTIASVIGREFNLDQLMRLIDDLPEEQLLEHLEEALSSRVIGELPQAAGQYEFSHALIRETLINELSTTRRVRLHARIAAALEDLYVADVETHAAELSHHCFEAEAVLGSEKLVRYSLMAGEHALANYAYEEALFQFERALSTKEGQPMDADTAALLFGLGPAQVATLGPGQVEEAVGSLTRAFDFYAETRDICRAVTVANYPLVIIGGRGMPRMAEIIARALEFAPPDSYQAGRLLSRYGTALGSREANYQAASGAFNDALVIAQREGDPKLEVRTLVDACRLDAFNLHFQESLAKSRRALGLLDSIDDPASEVPARYWAATTLLLQGDLPGAEAQAQAMLSPAEKARHKPLLTVAFWINAPVARIKGEWESARYFVQLGLENNPREITAHIERVLIEYKLGNFEQGEVFLEQMLGLQSPYLVARLYPARTIALIARITGAYHHLELAQENLEGALASPESTRFSQMLARGGLGLIAVLREDADAARRHYEALGSVRFGEMFGHISTDRLYGLLTHTMGSLDQAVTHFEDALRFCRNGFRPELAWTCHDFASTLLQRNNPGDGERSRSLLEESLSVSTDLGMRPLTDRIINLQQQVHSGPAEAPAYPDGLAQREVEVLRRIAAGRTDREIAEELFISSRTVNNHVRSILNKTALANRTEAAGYAVRLGLSP